MKIEKLPSGNYRIRVYMGKDADGKKITKSFTHYDKAKLRLIAAQYQTAHKGSPHRQTISKAMDAFLKAKAAVLSPSTVKAYTSLSDTLKASHAHFCGLWMDDLNQETLQALINDMVADGLKPKSIQNYHGFLSAVYKYAGEQLPPVTLPQKAKPVIRIPTEETVKKILAETKGTRLEIPIALATMGLRRSEICALSPEDLDGNTLHIHGAVVYGEGNKLVTKATKTESSDRYIQIPKALADQIRANGITDYTPAGLSAAFRLFLKHQKIPHFRLHDLRHFFVSYCHNILHLSDAQIQAITGHKTSVVLRANYLHAMDIEKSGALVAEKIADLI